MIYGNEQGVCQLCPVDYYCLNTELNTCPPGTTSPLGSNSLGDCTTNQGAPATTTTPGPQTVELSTVTFTVTLQLTLAEFNSTVREAYIEGVATALSTQVSNVAIGAVTEVVARRRLLSTSIEVETVVTVPSTEAESLANATTAENLNAGLGPSIEVGDVSAPVVETVMSTTTPPPSPPYVPPAAPPPPPIPSEWVSIGC